MLLAHPQPSEPSTSARPEPPPPSKPSVEDVYARAKAMPDVPRLTAKQVADIFGVSVRTLAEWVTLGQFPPPFTRNKRHHRWSWGAIEAHHQKMQSCK